MAETYSHTTWRVKPERETEFVRRWAEWAEWSHRQGLAADARLLRDIENPGTYVSFGPWASIEAVSSWRSLAGYNERVARLAELVISFEPRTFELVAER
jgi:heme-degrading monooxygenase HmoA